MNHLHFLQLVSVLHKRGGWGREETCKIDKYLMFILTGKKKKQNTNKKTQNQPNKNPPKNQTAKPIIATLWGWLETSMTLPPNCQENAAILTWATGRCLEVMLCSFQHTHNIMYHFAMGAAVQWCAFLGSAPFPSKFSSRVLPPLLLGCWVRRESSWRVGKLVFCEPLSGWRRDGARKCPLVLGTATSAAVMVFVLWSWSSGWKLRWRHKITTAFHFTWLKI